ncbi:cytochrome P450, partial [Escherichia coli]|nr:cytochrome P450 [Escherichia coli]
MSQVGYDQVDTIRLGNVPPGVPVITFDPYSDEVMSNPYPYYQEMREAGPLVWIQKYG